MQCNLITEYYKMCAQRTILSVCRSCERYFTTTSVSQSSRYLKAQTAVNRAAMTVKQLDIGVERELKRIERLRKKKEKKDVLQRFYARSAVINKKFISDVAQVLKGYPELRGLGMVVTKTKVDVNFTTLQVYWSSGKMEQEEKISAILVSKEAEINRKVREVLGEIPVLAFINDVNYTSSGTMELLFNKVKTETEPEGDLIDQLGEISLESQVGQVDRSQLLSGIAAAQSRSRAEHRIDLEKEEAFKADYMRSVDQHGGEAKKETRRRIKQFLNQRNKPQD